jgi:hypothetical protein
MNSKQYKKVSLIFLILVVTSAALIITGLVLKWPPKVEYGMFFTGTIFLFFEELFLRKADKAYWKERKENYFK